MINKVLVLGAGSAGLIAACTLKRRLPNLRVEVLRSKDIGIIGVGEGTTPTVTKHLHGYLDLDLKAFYAAVRPVWKLGIRYIWGPRPLFNYAFGPHLDTRYVALPKETGFYCDADADVLDCGMNCALIARNKAFVRGPNGLPQIGREISYHLENERLVAFMEGYAERLGVHTFDDTVVDVRVGENGVESLVLASGGTATADLFIDCSGFRSALLGKALNEPFVSFKSSLFCDRAVVGGWDRTDLAAEPVQPFTTAETMDAGWCFRIDHEHRVNRGYVYSSAFITDDAAEREFRAKNPKIETTRLVKFVSGHYRNGFVKNVVAIGNAYGFVEPLEATALAEICASSQNLAELLAECDLQPRPSLRALYNARGQRGWEAIRRFLAVHYKFNARVETPFWRECLEKTDLSSAEPLVEYYRENGPSTLYRNMWLESTDQFGPDGYLAMFVGMKVPYRRTHVRSAAEEQAWGKILRLIRQKADEGLSAAEALALVHRPEWQWAPNFYK